MPFTPAGLARSTREASPDARVYHSYHTGRHGVTGDSEGASDPPQVPHVILEAKPGVSEAEFLRDVDWVRELVGRYQKLIDQLAELSAATGPSDLRRAATVFALVAFFPPDMPPGSVALVLDLLSPQQTQHYNDQVRGVVAAAVAVLRCSVMENPQIQQWLDGEIKSRPALDFRARDAMRWFFDCNNDNASIARGTRQAFDDFRPATSLSLTEAAAKERAAQMLDTVARMKSGPLTRPRRPS